MELARFATPVDYVGFVFCGNEGLTNSDVDWAKLARKMGSSKTSMGSSNLRPKDAGPGSPH